MNQQLVLQEKMQWAQAVSTASLLPPSYQKQPGNLLLAAEYADTLGIPRMSAITGIHVIQGKPTMGADLMAAQVRRAGHKLRVKASASEAVAQIIRADDPDFVYECRWTLERAKNAGLLSKQGGNWSKYPEAMMKARAISEVVREACSEVLFGAVYTPEELGAVVDADGDPEPAEIVLQPVTEPAHVPVEDPDVWSVEQTDAVTALVERLGLDDETVHKTSRYVTGHYGVQIGTSAHANAMIEYLQSRLQDAEAAVDVPAEDAEADQ